LAPGYGLGACARKLTIGFEVEPAHLPDTLLTPVLLASSLGGPSPPTVARPHTSEKQRVTYTFRSSERGVPARRIRFRCAIDSKELRACPRRLTIRVVVGRHALRVQAVDPRGRRSSTTTVRVRIFEPCAPETRVGAAPLNVIAAGGTLWSENYGDGTISALDAGTRGVRSIAVGGQPVANGGGWVVALYGKVLARIDPASRQVVTRIPTPGQASGVLATADAVWFANYDLGTVSRVSRESSRVVRTYRVGRQPRGIAESAGAIWVANQASNSGSRITPSRSVSTSNRTPTGERHLRLPDANEMDGERAGPEDEREVLCLAQAPDVRDLGPAAARVDPVRVLPVVDVQGRLERAVQDDREVLREREDHVRVARATCAVSSRL
jgi:hypothetical protein